MSPATTSNARARLALEQGLMARFLDDPAFEAAVRDDPEALALTHGVAVEWMRRLAAITPVRVAAFRASRAHKDRIRQRGRGG